MMSKVLSMFLHTRIIKFAGIINVLGILSGCLFASDYPYVLFIDNKSTTPIAYSHCYPVEGCIHTINSGSYKYLTYISRGHKPSEKEIRESFDNQFYIIICEKPIEFKRIREVSPLTKLDWDSFDIVIDEKVFNTFCQQNP